MIATWDDGTESKITECPHAFVGAEIVDLVEMFHHFDNHVMPVAGGVLDQTDNFRQAYRLWKSAVDDCEKQNELDRTLRNG